MSPETTATMSSVARSPVDDIGDVLRGRGMRSTPQRRAILSVFHGGRTEHLSADEVYAQASRLLPDLSRATVYATLAEFSELGLLSAFGSPEPVRYETRVEPHAHLRCHLCLRVFDLVGGQQDPGQITDPGFSVERIETRAEGICDECADYQAGPGDRRTSDPQLRAGDRDALAPRRCRLRAGKSDRTPVTERHGAGTHPSGLRGARRRRSAARARRDPSRRQARTLPSRSSNASNSPVTSRGRVPNWTASSTGTAWRPRRPR